MYHIILSGIDGKVWKTQATQNHLQPESCQTVFHLPKQTDANRAHIFLAKNEKVLKTAILALGKDILTLTLILRWYSDGNTGKYVEN